jgi:hypothetical protein
LNVSLSVAVVGVWASVENADKADAKARTMKCRVRIVFSGMCLRDDAISIQRAARN